jgi:hypothetical protein
VWLPNPAKAEAFEQPRAKQPFRAPYPFVRPHYLLNEMLNRHHVDNDFLYVTDGAHFENLGLVELLRRGCTEIYCFDASGGEVGDFTTLGQAIALAESDLRIEIRIEPRKMLSDDGAKFVTDHILGTIHYPNSDVVGVLVYARPAVFNESPWDVQAFQEKHRAFPNDPTRDQLYTNERFDAYRRLGCFTGARVVAAMEEERQRRQSSQAR